MNKGAKNSSWQRFKEDKPGSRFQNGYRGRQQNRRGSLDPTRLFYAGGGAVLIVASLLLGFLPLLGLGSAALGLGMLASEFWPAAWLMDWGEVRARKLADFARGVWKSSSTVGKALIVAVILICAVALGYGAYYLFFGG